MKYLVTYHIWKGNKEEPYFNFKISCTSLKFYFDKWECKPSSQNIYNSRVLSIEIEDSLLMIIKEAKNSYYEGSVFGNQIWYSGRYSGGKSIQIPKYQSTDENYILAYEILKIKVIDAIARQNSERRSKSLAEKQQKGYSNISNGQRKVQDIYKYTQKRKGTMVTSRTNRKIT